MTDIRTWDDFLSACENCRACPLAETRDRVVVWRGSIQAPRRFIGEGPGAGEDRRGLPFVGAAGRVQDSALEELGLTEDLIHVANIV